MGGETAVALTSENPADAVDSLFSLLRLQGDGDYIGEHISQLDHCLQAAHSARQAGAPETTILAALLHDVGQFLPYEGTRDLLYEGRNVGRVGHERLGEDWLRENGWPREVTELVGAHVIAKRWLTSSSQAYLDGLSDASKQSLVLQGGPFTSAEAASFEQDPLWKEKVALRKWDDAAKVVNLPVPGLEAYRDIAISVLRANISGGR